VLDDSTFWHDFAQEFGELIKLTEKDYYREIKIRNNNGMLVIEHHWTSSTTPIRDRVRESAPITYINKIKIKDRNTPGTDSNWESAEDYAEQIKEWIDLYDIKYID
jgi:hypothetical protein